MKRSISLLSLVLLAGLAACEDSESNPIAGPQFRPGKGGPKDPSVQLKATFRDAVTDRIKSDGAGPYIHKSCGVANEATAVQEETLVYRVLLHPDVYPIRGNEDCSVIPRYYQIPINEGNAWPAILFVDGVGDISMSTGEQEHLAYFKVFVDGCNTCGCRFMKDGDDVDHVVVTFNGTDTWEVESAGDDRAECTSPTATWIENLPFKMTFTLKP
jgi:hypothetical protein